MDQRKNLRAHHKAETVLNIRVSVSFQRRVVLSRFRLKSITEAANSSSLLQSFVVEKRDVLVSA